MDDRIKLLLKKTRPLQLLFVVVAVVCLLVFLVINFSLNDRSGAFAAHSNVQQQVEVPVTRSGLDNLTIEASNVKLEVGMVSSLSKPQVILSGEGYENQLAKVDLEGTDCTIRLLDNVNPANVEDLTMQVLLPEGDYTSVAITGTGLNVHVDGLRTSFFLANVLDSGYAYFAGVKADNMMVNGGDTPLRFYDNQVAVLSVDNDDGSVTLLENAFERVDVGTRQGGIFCYCTRVGGQWNLQSQFGDVTMLSKNLPYNLTIQALGDFTLGYEGRYWDDADIISYGDDMLTIATVGNNPNKVIEVMGATVSVGQRERYSDLDPYAADYPFAETNPYMIERSTITK